MWEKEGHERSPDTQKKTEKATFFSEWCSSQSALSLSLLPQTKRWGQRQTCEAFVRMELLALFMMHVVRHRVKRKERKTARDWVGEEHSFKKSITWRVKYSQEQQSLQTTLGWNQRKRVCRRREEGQPVFLLQELLSFLALLVIPVQFLHKVFAFEPLL